MKDDKVQHEDVFAHPIRTLTEEEIASVAGGAADVVFKGGNGVDNQQRNFNPPPR